MEPIRKLVIESFSQNESHVEQWEYVWLIDLFERYRGLSNDQIRVLGIGY
jgi:hypothetical protein